MTIKRNSTSNDALTAYRATLARLTKSAHRYTEQVVIEHTAVILYDDCRKDGRVKSIIGYVPRPD